MASLRFLDKPFESYRKFLVIISDGEFESLLNKYDYKFKKGVFVIIRNNKLVLYLPFSNNFFKNNWYDKIYFTEEEKRLIQTQGYEKVKHLLNKGIIDYMNKHRDQYKFKKINFKREEWVANGCFFARSSSSELRIHVSCTCRCRLSSHTGKCMSVCTFQWHNSTMSSYTKNVHALGNAQIRA